MTAMKGASIGIDIADIARFRKFAAQKKDRFLTNTFSENEREYCFSYRDPAPHLAGMFAAKEAVRKTSKKFLLPFSELEVRHHESGSPEMWVRGRKVPSLAISITHASEFACAVALKN